MAIKVVAFDVYNTLGKWPPTRVQSYEVQQLLERFGIYISYQVFEAARQATLFLDTLKRPINSYLDFLALQFARMEVKVSTDLLESIAALYHEKNNFVFFDDALPALTSVRDLGLTTFAFTTIPKFMLGRTAGPIVSMLDHYFDSPAVGFAKGDLRYYRRIPELLGVGPHEIVCIGDDEICDCLLPAQAGWKPWRVIREGKAVVEHPDYRTVASLHEFVRMFQKN
jgi:FMN phosphatase YigB (HAD superfamily)